jgi:NADH-dependent peroxiredoxin subunit F
MYDLAIIGGGPAGVAAGVYAARKQLTTAFITDEWGGQSVVSDDIQNWIGTSHISGKELARTLEDHLKEYAGDVVTLFPATRAVKIEESESGSETFFTITKKSGGAEDTLTARTILLCVGSHRRQLPAKNAELYEHKGLTYCASCDGPLFADQPVVVVGGGNAALESAAQLLAYCSHVTIIMGAEISEVYGDGFVEGVKYRTLGSEGEAGPEQTLATSGVFVEIGLIPNTDFLGDLVPLNDYKQIIIDPWTQKTETAGIWAAGDCTNIRYHQNNIAAGDAVRALEDIYTTLRA